MSKFPTSLLTKDIDVKEHQFICTYLLFSALKGNKDIRDFEDFSNYYEDIVNKYKNFKA